MVGPEVSSFTSTSKVGKRIAIRYQDQEEEAMSSRLKVTNGVMTSAERLTLEMGVRLQKAAGQDLKNKMESGEVNGRYVGLGLTVSRPKKTRIRPTFVVVK